MFTPLVTPLKTWALEVRPATTVDGRSGKPLGYKRILERCGTCWDDN